MVDRQTVTQSHDMQTVNHRKYKTKQIKTERSLKAEEGGREGSEEWKRGRVEHLSSRLPSEVNPVPQLDSCSLANIQHRSISNKKTNTSISPFPLQSAGPRTWNGTCVAFCLVPKGHSYMFCTNLRTMI